jgi:hypothetical protein
MESTERPGGAVGRNRDVHIRGVLLFGFWLAVGAIVVQLGVWGLFRVLAREQRSAQMPLSPMVAASLQRTPPEPRLEPAPLALRRKLRAEEDAILTTYQWVDKKAGVVRLPIDRAMELLVVRGLPPAQPMPAAASAPAPGGKP